MPTNRTDRLLALMAEFHRFLRMRFPRPTKGAMDMSFLQMHALFHISEHEGVTMKDLSKLLKVSSPSATAMVDRLARQKLVTRHEDHKNRKLVHVTMTKKGTLLLQRNIRMRKRVIGGMLRLLPHQDQDALIRIFERLTDHLRSTQ